LLLSGSAAPTSPEVPHVDHGYERSENMSRASTSGTSLEGTGKVLEHWDVIQPIPETSANANTMF
jgi:predicted SnoaL-like aldol condensation-catalyzing enzyme